MLVAGLALTLRAQALATQAVLGRIEETQRLTAAKLSVAARVRALLDAGGPAAPRADGQPLRFSQDGRDWEVRLTDVEGLVDLYLAPEDVLALLTGDGRDLGRRRSAALAPLPPGARFASEDQTLARFGFDAADRARLAPLATQRARTGEINLAVAPAELQATAGLLARRDTAAGDLAELSIRLLP
jgi:hypothetical protein